MLRREDGQALILLAVALTTLLGFAALTVDVGRWYVARQRATNVCDMAALGAAMELTKDARSAERAQQAALSVIDANNAAGAAVNVSHVIGRANPDIIISYYNDTVATNPNLTADIRWTDSQGNPLPRPAPNYGILVRGRVPVAPIFGQALDFKQPRQIPARTTVVLGQASTIIGGILPFGVSKDHIVDLEAFPSATIEHELTYRTWKDSWTGAPGAFGTLAPGEEPGSTSASILETNVIWGYPGTFKVGDVIATTNGNMTGPLRDGIDARLDRSLFPTINDWLAAFNSDSPAARALAMHDARLVLLPIVDESTIVRNGSGTAQSVQIHGFATYAISGWNNSSKQVFGYFVKSNYEGSVSPSGVNYGTLAYHLL